jgi:hypothetical protein
MAYVAISGALIEDVQDQIKKLRGSEVKTIPEVTRYMKMTAIPEDLELLVWGQHNNLRDVIPHEWKREREDITLRVDYVSAEGTEQRIECQINFVGSRLVCPPNAGGYYHTIIVDANYHLVAPYVAYAKQVHEIDERWDKVKEQIIKFLKGCKSLNEALKLWPDVRIYIPKQYIERIERKVERASADSSALDILKSIDTDGAVAAAVGARLASAAGGSNV